jgi:hypothetical protein
MYRGILAIATVIIAIIAWVIALASRKLFSVKKKKLFLIKIFTIAISISLFLYYPIKCYSKIAYSMWDRQVELGAVRFSDISKLGGIHILFLIMFMVLVITLWIRLFNRFSRSNWFTVLGSIIFFICINISFYYSYPRYGDEGVEVLLFTLLAFFFADLILIITILIFVISSIIRQIKEIHTKNVVTENQATLNEE